MVAENARNWSPGNPLDPSTAMGPMIDKGQFNTVSEYVEIGRNEGAELLFGGNQTLQETGGYYHEPSIFGGVNNAMRIAQDGDPGLAVANHLNRIQRIQVRPLENGQSHLQIPGDIDEAAVGTDGNGPGVAER